KIYKWSYIKFTPSGYMWKPKSPTRNDNPNVSLPLDNVSKTANVLKTKTSRWSNVSNIPLSSNSFAARRKYPIHRRLWCSKHMTGNLKLPINLVEKFMGTVKFGNDQIVPILGYGDLVQELKSTCFIRDLKGNDLLTGSRGTDLYSITLQDTNSPNPICLMAKATSSQAWLWHRRLSHLNFDTINLLLKNDIVVGLPKLKFIKDHLYSSCLRMKLVKFSLISSGLSKEDFKLNLEWFELIKSRAYRVFNKRTRVIMESIHVNFDELPQMASDQNSSDPAPKCQTMALEHDSLSPGRKCQENVSHGDKTVVSKSSAVPTADESIQCQQQQITPLVNHTTP
nr:hypothetical protein [Tanacetum cinerariifolium]